MKKLFLVLALTASIALSGCNYKLFDTNYRFDVAVIRLPDGSVITGEVQSWRDFEDGDQIEVKVDGTVYLVHSTNVALLKIK